MSALPLTMRHGRRQARWAVARFDDGSFALYRRGVNNVWHSVDRNRPAVFIALATIHAVKS